MHRNSRIPNSGSPAADGASAKQVKESHISEGTRKLYECRHRLLHQFSARSTVEFSVVSKALRESLKADIERKHLSRIHQAISSGRSIRKALQTNKTYTRPLKQLKRNDGTIARTSADVEAVVQDFFNNLFSSTTPSLPQVLQGSEDLPPILPREVRNALSKMKVGKAPEPDNITVEMLISGYHVLEKPSTKLFNECLEREHLPASLADSVISLLFKKGDPLDIGNFRPIALLSTVYKLFSSILAHRMLNCLEVNQPVEQAGFRRKYSTVDHIHVINQLIEKSHEYKFPLYMAFVDFSKAFDSVEYDAIWKSLMCQGVHPKIIRLLSNIYASAEVAIKISANPVPIQVSRGVRQGDPISPALFAAVLETIFRNMDWSKKGININGCYLNHLRYADDIVIFAHDAKELERMLQEMSENSDAVGLKINLSKTVIMSNSVNIPILIDGRAAPYCTSFAYLGQRVSFDGDLTAEISRRIQSGWSAFSRFRPYFTNRRIPMKFKRRLYVSCVEPSLLYGCETWVMRKKEMSMLVIAQRKMMRRMLGVTILDHRTNGWLQSTTKLPEISSRAIERKWTWAKKVAEVDVDRWTRRITEWRPWTWKRSTGRPRMRWRDVFIAYFGETWMRAAASDSATWRRSMKRHIETI
ncbi:hypothetical protein Y032_0026g1397 [Ancylostoma ceylanicum]|uniref:Reverse transcriptase domain-containing protein n=1 Tax=Ancylostoma ceylanicum TaxID=53326 RepID=A0A016UWI5_9BILA|nr:hypothetical protein Y032_0026g1397 [Ancylostoma ceylanicum]